MRAMKLIALLLALPLLFVSTQAAPDDTAKIVAAGDGDDATWQIERGGDIDIEALMTTYCTSRKRVVISVPGMFRTMARIIVPEGGRTLKGTEIDLLVQDALETGQNRITMRLGDNNTILFCPTAEAITYAQSLTEAELEKANPAFWANVVFRPRNTDANVLRGAMQNLVSRPGGQVSPVPGAALVITDRAGRLRNLLKTARELDAREARTLKTYDAPAGMEAEACEKALSKLFSENVARFAGLNATRKVMAMAAEDQHPKIVEALAQMK